MVDVLEKPRQGWMRAHWKLLLALWLGLSLSGAIVAFVLMTNSDAARLAIVTAESNAVLIERLGLPMKTGWFISGKIEVTPASGHAELAIPVSGPRGRGTIYVESHKKAGVWQLEMLQFVSKGSGERLDLLVPDRTPKPAAATQ